MDRHNVGIIERGGETSSTRVTAQSSNTNPPTPLGVSSACEALPVSLSHWGPKLKILGGRRGSQTTPVPPDLHTL